MFNWLKKLFGSNIPDTPVIAQEPVVEVKPSVKTTAKPKKAKSEKVDLESMNKTQLLAEAKKRGIKANASLKKDEVLARIKNG